MGDTLGNTVATGLRPGVLLERWRVEGKIGTGSMSEVWRLRHRELGTLCALKLLRASGPGLRERLLEEGRLQAGVRHVNVVPVLDVLEVHGVPALLMDYVNGGNLAQKLAATGGVPVSRRESLFEGILAGVEAAHRAGLVHCNLSPSRILIEEDEQGQWVPRVSGFGLARSIEEGGSRPERGEVMEHPEWGTPETVSGERAWDPRSDVFALGAIAYALCTGKSPFQAENAATCLKRVARVEWNGPPEGAAGVLGTVMGLCLRVDLGDRPRDAGELRERLKALASARVPTEEPAKTIANPEGWSKGVHGGEGRGARSCTVSLLGVDAKGVGEVFQLVVRIEPGTGEVIAGAGIERDAALAGQVAVQVALGADAGRWRVTWGLSGGVRRLRGSSLGLGLAVAVRAAREGRILREGLAFTGGLDIDGRVVGVEGIDEKVSAARKDGLSLVFLPGKSENGSSRWSLWGWRREEALGAPGETLVRRVEAFDQVWSALYPRRARPDWRWMGVFVVGLLGLSGLGEAFDNRIHGYWTRGLGEEMRAEQVLVLAVPPQADLRGLRARWPVVIRELARKGAGAVVFDIAMSAPDPRDQAIVEAIEEVEREGVAVYLPVRMAEEGERRPGTLGLAQDARLGIVEAREDSVFGEVQAIVAGRGGLAGGPARWHLGVLAAGALINTRGEPKWEEGELRVGSLRLSAPMGEVRLPPAGEVPRANLDALNGLDSLAGKAVFIGLIGAPEDHYRTADGPRAGVEVLALACETVLRQRGLRHTSRGVDGLVAMTLGGLGGLLGRLSRRVVFAGVGLLGAVGVGLALASAGLIVGWTAILAGGVLGVWLAAPRAGAR
jgi:CHASE2 domain-containing sensor protein